MLPEHESYQITYGLSQTCVVRYSRAKGKPNDLHIYRFADKQELKAVSGILSVAHAQCISPDGERVCWLEKSRDDLAHKVLKTFDVASGQVSAVDVSWPEDQQIEWDAPKWLDNRMLAVQGRRPRYEDSRDDPYELLILRVNVETRETNLSAAAMRFRRWRLSPDASRAFACGATGERDMGVRYVNLRTGKQVSLGGYTLPVWQRDSRSALRVTYHDGDGHWLCRFDTETLTETLLLKIPDKTELIAPSPNGRFALLRRTGMAIRPISLVDVATGRQKHLDLSLTSTLFLWGEFPSRYDHLAGLSIWSGNETRFMLQAIDIDRALAREPDEVPVRTYLYSVPEDWMKQ